MFWRALVCSGKPQGMSVRGGDGGSKPDSCCIWTLHYLLKFFLDHGIQTTWWELRSMDSLITVDFSSSSFVENQGFYFPRYSCLLCVPWKRLRLAIGAPHDEAQACVDLPQTDWHPVLSSGLGFIHEGICSIFLLWCWLPLSTELYAGVSQELSMWF